MMIILIIAPMMTTTPEELQKINDHVVQFSPGYYPKNGGHGESLPRSGTVQYQHQKIPTIDGIIRTIVEFSSCSNKKQTVLKYWMYIESNSSPLTMKLSNIELRFTASHLTPRYGVSNLAPLR